MCDIVGVVFFRFLSQWIAKVDLVLTTRGVLICGIFPIAEIIGSPKTYARFETGTIGTHLLRV